MNQSMYSNVGDSTWSGLRQRPGWRGSSVLSPMALSAISSPKLSPTVLTDGAIAWKPRRSESTTEAGPDRRGLTAVS